jgi:hypothetical protein
VLHKQKQSCAHSHSYDFYPVLKQAKTEYRVNLFFFSIDPLFYSLSKSRSVSSTTTYRSDRIRDCSPISLSLSLSLSRIFCRPRTRTHAHARPHAVTRRHTRRRAHDGCLFCSLAWRHLGRFIRKCKSFSSIRTRTYV